MRRIYPLLIAISALALPNFASAQTVTSDPVGFETVTVGSGRVGALSLPLDNLPVFSGAVTSRTSSTLMTTGAGFGSLSTAAAPYLVRFRSGTATGRHFLVTANDSQTLTVNNGGTDLTTIVAAGDTYSVHPIQTLSSFFGQAADPNKPAINRNGDSNVADNILLRGSFGYLTYYNDGANWLLVGGGSTPQNDVQLLPDKGFLFVRRPGTAISISVVGAVPITNTLRTDLLANKITIFPNRFPVGTTLAGLGLNGAGAWTRNDDASLADNILIRGTFGWSTYYLNTAGTWLLVGGGATPQDTTAIPVGASVLASRRSGTNINLDQARPYNLP
jgi:uncharacterized protein (TIGR02597 family)